MTLDVSEAALRRFDEQFDRELDTVGALKVDSHHLDDMVTFLYTWACIAEKCDDPLARVEPALHVGREDSPAFVFGDDEMEGAANLERRLRARVRDDSTAVQTLATRLHHLCAILMRAGHYDAVEEQSAEILRWFSGPEDPTPRWPPRPAGGVSSDG